MEYEKMKLSELQTMIEGRNINCKINKIEMIRVLKLDDSDKYIRETTYDKHSFGFIVGIDIRNIKQQIEISKMVEKKDAMTIGRYSNDFIYYITKQKLI